MHWLSDAAFKRLRDRLRERGQRPSIALPGANLPPSALELLAVSSEYGPLCDAMYLMMSADGRVSHEERVVLKGALRGLSDDQVRGSHIEAMLDAAAKHVAAEGREQRMRSVIQALADDPVRAEVAFVLVAAIALADDVIVGEEDELLGRMAEGLGIDTGRARELMEIVEREIPETGAEESAD